MKIFSSALRRLRVLLALRRARESTVTNLSSARDSKRLLVVCYGNIYRSPLVAELLRKQLPSIFQVRSAGFHAKSDRCSPNAHVQMCLNCGVDLSSHRSSVISLADTQWADLIVLMDRHNWYALDALGADSSKFVWLGALDDVSNTEIADPYGMSPADARRIVDRVIRATERLVAQLTSD